MPTFTELCQSVKGEEYIDCDSLPAETLWCIEPREFAVMLDAVNREFQAAKHDRRRMRRNRPTRRRSVAVIPLYGPLSKAPSLFQALFGGDGLGTTTAVRLAVNAAAADPEIDSILLRIDSPGGSVDGLAELVDAVAAAAQAKEVIAQVEGTMASAALHVGAQATKIFSHRMDMIGSIGARMLIMDTSKMFEEMGIVVHAIDTGKFKSAGAMGTEVTPEHLAHFQEIVDAFFDDFTQGVSTGRKMPMEDVLELADGRMFMAADAVASGLIDGIQTTEETLAQMTGEVAGGISQGTGRRADTLSRHIDIAEKEYRQIALDDL